MEATSPQNLQGFLDMYSFHGKYVLSCSDRTLGMPENWASVLANGILMKNLVIRQAWEIGRHDPDSVGLRVGDDVIVPEGIENPPVIELLEWKKSRGEERL